MNLYIIKVQHYRALSFTDFLCKCMRGFVNATSGNDKLIQNFQHIRSRRRQTVAQGLHNGQWIRSISGSLTVQAIYEYLHLWVRISEVQLSAAENVYIWRWTSNGQYTSKSAYAMLHQGSMSFSGSRRIWKSWAPQKIKFFIWLASRKKNLDG